MIVRHGRLLLARMWHTRKSRWVIDLVVGLGTAIAEDLQVTNGHPCALGEDAAHLRENVGRAYLKDHGPDLRNVAEVGCLRAGHSNGRMGLLTSRPVITP